MTLSPMPGPAASGGMYARNMLAGRWSFADYAFGARYVSMVATTHDTSSVDAFPAQDR